MADQTAVVNRLPPALGAPEGWPDPDPAAERLSSRLVRHIRKQIRQQSGVLDFARFMDLMLYTPGLGYYSGGLSKFGAEGDFVTAPEISPLFSRCIARCCGPVLAGLGGGDILELGAGSGVMAADVLAELAQRDQLPTRYLILETSAALRERQRNTLGSRVPALVSRVHWLDQPPESGLHGVILANEVVDALPVHRFQWDNAAVWELKVVCKDEGFDWRPVRLQEGRLYTAVADLIRQLDLVDGYRSEVNLDLGPWLATIARPLQQGLLLLIDYGYSRAEYYHPQRSMGTLSCHYRHRVHDNPFILPGLQDITAHVDFTALMEAAIGLGLDLVGFTSQAHFLFDAGLQEILAAHEPRPDVRYLDLTRQIKMLTLPGEMGERFRCMALGRGVVDIPPGFRRQDLRRIL